MNTILTPFSSSKPAVKMTKIIGARCFDLMLWIGIGLLFYLPTLNLTPRWIYILSANLLLLGAFLVLFTVLPKLFAGKTPGRCIFKITLVSQQAAVSLPWRYFFVREFFIVLLPCFLLALYLTFIRLLVPEFLPHTRAIFLLLPLWFALIFFFQKFNPAQQLFIDRYYQAWIIDQTARPSGVFHRLRSQKPGKVNK